MREYYQRLSGCQLIGGQWQNRAMTAGLGRSEISRVHEMQPPLLSPSSDLVQMTEHVGGILVHAIRAGPFELLETVAT